MLKASLRNLTLCSVLRNSNMKLIRTPANQNFQCRDLKGVRLVTASKLGFSHHSQHKFKHVFKMP